MSTTQQLERTIAVQDQLIEALGRDPEYDILTRPGLQYIAWPKIAAEATFVVFADIDNMHAVNDLYGWDGANERIRLSLHDRKLGPNRLCDVGCWMSGDEILWIIREGDPAGLARSIQRALQAQGLSATFGIAPVISADLPTNVLAAKDLVFQAKQQRRRGTINCLP